MRKKTIEESYNVSTKHSNKPKIPLLMKWRDRKIYNSLTEVNDYINSFSQKLWKYIGTKAEKNNSKLILTFLSIPQWGHHESNKWRDYETGKTPKYYLHIKIQSILKLKESKLEQLTEEKEK